MVYCCIVTITPLAITVIIWKINSVKLTKRQNLWGARSWTTSKRAKKGSQSRKRSQCPLLGQWERVWQPGPPTGLGLKSKSDHLTISWMEVSGWYKGGKGRAGKQQLREGKEMSRRSTEGRRSEGRHKIRAAGDRVCGRCEGSRDESSLCSARAQSECY